MPKIKFRHSDVRPLQPNEILSKGEPYVDAGKFYIGDGIKNIDQLSSVGGVSGCSGCVIVYGKGTDMENGNELIEAYRNANSLPSHLSNRRIKVLIFPGNYDLNNGTSYIDFSNHNIDFSSITGRKDVFIYSSDEMKTLQFSKNSTLEGISINESDTIGSSKKIHIRLDSIEWGIPKLIRSGIVLQSGINSNIEEQDIFLDNSTLYVSNFTKSFSGDSIYAKNSTLIMTFAGATGLFNFGKIDAKNSNISIVGAENNSVVFSGDSNIANCYGELWRISVGGEQVGGGDGFLIVSNSRFNYKEGKHGEGSGNLLFINSILSWDDSSSDSPFSIGCFRLKNKPGEGNERTLEKIVDSDLHGFPAYY